MEKNILPRVVAANFSLTGETRDVKNGGREACGKFYNKNN